MRGGGDARGSVPRPWGTVTAGVQLQLKLNVYKRTNLFLSFLTIKFQLQLHSIGTTTFGLRMVQKSIEMPLARRCAFPSSRPAGKNILLRKMHVSGSLVLRAQEYSSGFASLRDPGSLTHHFWRRLAYYVYFSVARRSNE